MARLPWYSWFWLLPALASAEPNRVLIRLHSGFEITAQRYEAEGRLIRIYSGSGETVLSRDAVAAIEVLETAPEPVPPPAPAITPMGDAASRLPATPRDLVRQAALKQGLPPEFVESVARAESGLQPGAISPKGAIGLMQLMPATASQLQANPRDPEQNAEAGARILRRLLIEYQNHPHQLRMALAAYNAGEGAVRKYGGVPPYAETAAYIDRVLRHYQKASGQKASGQKASEQKASERRAAEPAGGR